MPIASSLTVRCPGGATASVPALGFGTWTLRGDACVDAVADALALGYRHLDTAQYYDNEAAVGEGLRRAAVPRADVFLVTKVHPSRFEPAAFARSVEESLDRLGTDSVDLLLLHWANPDVPLAETLGAAADVQARGLARLIGVSNFTVPMVEEALGHADVCCNQMELHPFHPQDALVEQARARGLLFTAYSPLAEGRVATDPTLAEIGARHGKTAAQVALRWVVQQGIAAIPKASRPEHRAENLDVFDFELTDEEMGRVGALGR